MTNKKIILISGVGGSGKDTFVELLGKYISTQNNSSVDQIKEMATLIGWNGGKDERSRKFLSDLKVLCSEYNNAPMAYMLGLASKFNESQKELLCIHSREPKELCSMKLILKNMGFEVHTILVRRSCVKKITSNMADKNVENFLYDHIIKNNGTMEELDGIARKFVKEVLNEKK